MGSGKKKAPKTEKTTSTTTNTPFAVNTPWGSTSVSGNTVSLNPIYQPGQQEQMQLQNSKLQEVLQGLPTDFTAEGAFNNPFYASTLGLLQSPIKQRFDIESRGLARQLAARGQLGNSQGLFARRQQEDNYNRLLGEAESQARGTAYNAYTGQRAQGLALLQALRQDQSAQFEQMYAPLLASLRAGNATSNTVGVYPAAPKSTGGGLNPFTSAMTGIQTGAQFGPYGAIAGGLLGAGAGFAF